MCVRACIHFNTRASMCVCVCAAPGVARCACARRPCVVFPPILLRFRTTNPHRPCQLSSRPGRRRPYQCPHTHTQTPSSKFITSSSHRNAPPPATNAVVAARYLLAAAVAAAAGRPGSSADERTRRPPPPPTTPLPTAPRYVNPSRTAAA